MLLKLLLLLIKRRISISRHLIFCNFFSPTSWCISIDRAFLEHLNDKLFVLTDVRFAVFLRTNFVFALFGRIVPV